MTGPMSLEQSNPRKQKKPGSRLNAAAGWQLGCKTQLESDLTSVPDFHVMPLAAALSAEWRDSPQHNGDAIYTDSRTEVRRQQQFMMRTPQHQYLQNHHHHIITHHLII